MDNAADDSDDNEDNVDGNVVESVDEAETADEIIAEPSMAFVRNDRPGSNAAIRGTDRSVD